MTTADIVIIGGGVVGTTLAYRLAQRGIDNIVILERDTVASGSTGRATGGLRQQFADEIDIRFAMEGVRFYQDFLQEYASAPQDAPEPPSFYQYGYLFLVTQAQSWQAMQRHAALQRSLGTPTHLLSSSEVQQHIPQLVVDDVLGATFCPTDGYSDPGAIARALAYTVQRRGVLLREQTPVTGFTIKHQRIEAVHTPDEIIATPLVINATGAFSALVARLAGITDFPVYPLRRQLYLTEPFEDLPSMLPMVVDMSTGFHFRRREERLVIALPLPVSQEEQERNQKLAPEAFTYPVDEDLWWHICIEILKRCPVLMNAHIERCWSGLYEMTPDEYPILGRTEVDGFLCACGFSGHGFIHAPMAAKLLTELILDGASNTLPIEPFYLERFRTGKLLTATRLL